jgi:hypothetical protein
VAEIPPAEAASPADSTICHAERLDGRGRLREHIRVTQPLSGLYTGFQLRLAAAKSIRQGPGILIFCGNEFAWHRSDLEDFADFYHTGRHRADDPFALMEQHYLKENGVQLERTIDHFGFLKRYIEIPTMAEFYLPVEGPQFGRFPS